MNHYLSIKITCFMLLLCSGFTLSSCKKDTVRGEGTIITEDRSLQVQSGYHTVKINGEAKVYIRYGAAHKLEIKGYQNLLNIYSSDVVNNRLELGYRNHYNVRNDNIKVYITSPLAPDIDTNGSGDVDFSGDFPFRDRLSLTINGSGKIAYSNISTGQAYFSINGSGKIDAEDLETEEAFVNISGSGEIRFTVNSRLNVKISGSGKVYYKGRPAISQDISGSGKIISLD